MRGKSILAISLIAVLLIGVISFGNAFAEEKITICHYPDSDNAKTKQVKEKDLQKHLDHGDIEGECPIPPDPILELIGLLQAAIEDTSSDIQQILGLLTDPIFGLEEIKTSVDGIDTSGLATQSSVDDMQTALLSTTSFYQVEDIVTIGGVTVDQNFDVLVSLSCPSSVPAEVQAFTIETLGVQVSQTAGNQVMFFNVTVIDQSFGFFYGESVSEFIGSDLANQNQLVDHKDGSATTISASEEVRFRGNAVNMDSGDEIKMKVAAIGEKPLGCDVTIDADASSIGGIISVTPLP